MNAEAERELGRILGAVEAALPGGVRMERDVYITLTDTQDLRHSPDMTKRVSQGFEVCRDGLSVQCSVESVPWETRFYIHVLAGVKRPLELISWAMFAADVAGILDKVGGDLGFGEEAAVVVPGAIEV